MSNTRWWKESSSCKSGFLQDVSCLGSDICPWTGFFLSLFNHCHLGDRQQLPQRLRLWRAGARKGVTLSGILPVWCPPPPLPVPWGQLPPTVSKMTEFLAHFETCSRFSPLYPTSAPPSSYPLSPLSHYSLPSPPPLSPQSLSLLVTLWWNWMLSMEWWKTMVWASRQIITL